MWKCPVCETEYGDVTVCPRCGFDGSCDYEHYPTVFAVAGAKSTRALRREWEQKQGPGLDQLLWNWFVKTQEQPGDSTSAEACLRQLADSGNREAQLWLAGCYEYGVGAAKDLALAMDWYRKAAEQGSIPAQKRLAELETPGYRKGSTPAQFSSDEKVAAQKAAKRWYEEYLNEKNKQKAVIYLVKAAEMDYAQAQYKLGWCYYLGKGVPMDKTQAIEWYRKAADQGYAEAQCELGWRYLCGCGIPKDVAQAAKWYQKAADQGNGDAKRALRKMAKWSLFS